MKQFISAAILSLTAFSAAAQTVATAEQSYYAHLNNWVLLGLYRGLDTAVVPYNNFPDLPTPNGEGVPMYPTKAACQDAIKETITHKSRAEGNFFLYLCTDIRTWSPGQ
jgi:hypothetical protein